MEVVAVLSICLEYTGRKMQKDAESDISVTGTSEECGCAQAFAGPGRPLSPGRNCHPPAKSRTLRT